MPPILPSSEFEYEQRRQSNVATIRPSTLSKVVFVYVSTQILPLLQIISQFDFSKYMNFALHLRLKYTLRVTTDPAPLTVVHGINIQSRMPIVLDLTTPTTPRLARSRP